MLFGLQLDKYKNCFSCSNHFSVGWHMMSVNFTNLNKILHFAPDWYLQAQSWTQSLFYQSGVKKIKIKIKKIKTKIKRNHIILSSISQKLAFWSSKSVKMQTIYYFFLNSDELKNI